MIPVAIRYTPQTYGQDLIRGPKLGTFRCPPELAASRPPPCATRTRFHYM
ncbi:hypothetical protein RSAG8_03791, partial [Rhizoctonia solani AG-8 WAC10335]